MGVMRNAADWASAAFQMTPKSFHTGFRALLVQVGFHQDEALEFTSHAMRRGVAADVLGTHGLQAMLDYGDWGTQRSASHYATFDEMDQHALGTMAAELSEDDA